MWRDAQAAQIAEARKSAGGVSRRVEGAASGRSRVREAIAAGAGAESCGSYYRRDFGGPDGLRRDSLKRTLVAVMFGLLLVSSPASFAQEHAGASPEANGVEHTASAGPHGEAAAEAAEMPNEIWWKWANFAILVGGLGYLTSKHAPAFFRSRTEHIQQGIAEAARTRQEAESRAAEIERRVANLAAEVDQMRAKARSEIAREGERVRLETEAAIRKIQAQSQAEINSAVKHATHDLKAWSAQLALEMAEGQIRSQMSESEHEGLTNAFVSELRRKAGAH